MLVLHHINHLLQKRVRNLSIKWRQFMKTLLKLQTYMGGRAILLPGALALSALSSLMGMLPFIFIWLIVRELFRSTGVLSQELISTYAWWAMGTAIAGVVVYFFALTLSHLAAFRVETNMRPHEIEPFTYSFIHFLFNPLPILFSTTSNH